MSTNGTNANFDFTKTLLMQNHDFKMETFPQTSSKVRKNKIKYDAVFVSVS